MKCENWSDEIVKMSPKVHISKYVTWKSREMPPI